MLVRMSNWVWTSKKNYSVGQLSNLRSVLTLQPKRTSHYQAGEIPPIHLYEEESEWFGIPRSFFVENSKLENEIIDERSSGDLIGDDVVFVGKLKADQSAAIKVVQKQIDGGSPGGIIQATPGWGKTVVGIAAWLLVQRRTAIVIVQKEYLANQWKERIATFAPNARVGIIQQDRCEYGDGYDISIATIQTLVKRRTEYPSEFWDAFGLVITDETHRVGAPSWCQTATMFTGQYRLGLTATPRRRDNAQNVFFWHIGPIIYKSKTKRLTPRLRRIFTSFNLVKTSNFDPTLASKNIKLRFLCANPERNRLIVSELVKAAGVGRKMLVLSDRRKHLDNLNEMFANSMPHGCRADFYVGGRSQKELDVAAKADVVWGTYQMAREALDIPELDTLFLVTPSSDVEQAVGRIMREHPDKKPPVVTDFIDQHVASFVRLWNERRRFYVAHGMFKDGDGGKK